MATKEQVLELLKAVKYPGFSRDIVSFGLIQSVAIEGEEVRLNLKVTTSDKKIPLQLESEIKEALKPLEGIDLVAVDITLVEPVQAAASAEGGMQRKIPGVKNVIAVASGKGGVGKSTVASNIAVGLQEAGLKVGLCDCDLYGPSMGLMFGSAERPTLVDDETIKPVERYGLKLMSMGLLVDDNSPVILRGPMVTRYTQQFLNSVAWGELDVLVLDLPPGTGDIQLTISQTVAVTGAVIVTTPQEVALIDARKGVRMFEKVNIPVMGLVENMSYFICPNDGNRYAIFGEGGGRREADKLGVPLLAEVPLDIATREAADSGKPIVLHQPDSPAAKAFTEACRMIKDILS